MKSNPKVGAYRPSATSAIAVAAHAGARRSSRTTRKAGRGEKSPSSETELERRAEAAEAIPHASAEVDRGGLREVLRGTAHLADAEAEPERLGEHLIVEHEVIRVGLERKRFEDAPRVGAIARVELGELRAEQHVAGQGQAAV